jgi:hypothetical protein
VSDNSKRGKSTLINALVGQSVLPVGVVPVTSVVTILRHADRPGAFVYFVDGRTASVAVEDVGAFIDERRNPAIQQIGVGQPWWRSDCPARFCAAAYAW